LWCSAPGCRDLSAKTAPEIVVNVTCKRLERTCFIKHQVVVISGITLVRQINVCKFVTYASFGWVAQGEGKDMAFMGTNPKKKRVKGTCHSYCCNLELLER
jgi:hypothetical protein